MVKDYFQQIEASVKKCYDVAVEARKKELDPVPYVEIPLARNMAERVVGLLSILAPQLEGQKIVARVNALEQEYGVQDWRVALTLAHEVSQEKFCTFGDKKTAMEIGIRAGIAYVTNGIVSSPLEGFTRLEIRKRRDGKEYVALFFSGPIRSAGGTGASVSVLIGDYIRKMHGYEVYDPDEQEVKRFITELYDYHERVTNLQYLPSEKEIDFLARRIPVQIEGDPSEKFEVSNYKGLDRVGTDRIRNGVCLVLGEGIAQKAPKLFKQLSKWGATFGLDHWMFLDAFLQLQKEIKSKKVAVATTPSLKPDFTFIKDLVAGRPVFTYPLALGGFRLRYGRARNSGFSCQAVHPATMIIVNKFIAIGTQLKVERPGKSSVVGCCESLEGPIVKLHDGSVLFLEDEASARKYVKDVQEILHLGDILINHGDFLNRGHLLVPAGYCEEWYIQEVQQALEKKKDDVLHEKIQPFIQNPFQPISFDLAYEISEQLNVPMHPRYTFHWKELQKEELQQLHSWTQSGKHEDDKLILPLPESMQHVKRFLELIGVPHLCVNHEYVVVEKDWKKALVLALTDCDFSKNDILTMLNQTIIFRDKAGTAIGARMGRPEKAKMRKLTGSPQVLFPVGSEGGRMRCFQEALEKGIVTAQFPHMFCTNCKCESVFGVCEFCGGKTVQHYYCPICVKDSETKCKHDAAQSYKTKKIDIKKIFALALKKSGVQPAPELVKGVRGTSNKNHVPEQLMKGILRAAHNLYVNKDGTIRYDCTEMPLTHFKPCEIATDLETLKQLGYVKDIYGKDLERDDQILELFCQDVVLPGSSENLDEGSDEILFRTTQFIDDMLEKLYGLKKFYHLKNKQQLVGHFIVGLAPHISAGIVGRIIGFSQSQGFLAHPYFHSIMRRDCDGDESGLMLLMDALINFSRHYLPDHRGSTQDAPLVLTSKLIPKEVDDMVFDMDICWQYPLVLYEAALQFKSPAEVKIEKVRDHLQTEREYYGFGYTHPVRNINDGVRCSAYKILPTMMEKVLGQMDLATKIRAVNEHDVARLVIERHFIRDIKGNLRKYSSQQFRCVKCNEKYRRPPLAGVCLKCGGHIIFTISEGTITKYLEPSLSLAEKYALSPYLKQTLEMTKKRIESIFGREHEKQEGLVKWFG